MQNLEPVPKGPDRKHLPTVFFSCGLVVRLFLFFSLSSPHSITASPPPVNLFLSCLGACQSSLVSFFLVPAVHGATLFTCRKPFVRCSLRSSRLLKSSVEGAKRFNSSPPSLHCQPACVVDSPRRPSLSLALSSCSLSIYPEYISKAFIRILLGTTLPPTASPRLYLTGTTHLLFSSLVRHHNPAPCSQTLTSHGFSAAVCLPDCQDHWHL